MKIVSNYNNPYQFQKQQNFTAIVKVNGKSLNESETVVLEAVQDAFNLKLHDDAITVEWKETAKELKELITGFAEKFKDIYKGIILDFQPGRMKAESRLVAYLKKESNPSSPLNPHCFVSFAINKEFLFTDATRLLKELTNKRSQKEIYDEIKVV